MGARILHLLGVQCNASKMGRRIGREMAVRCAIGNIVGCKTHAESI